MIYCIYCYKPLPHRGAVCGCRSKDDEPRREPAFCADPGGCSCPTPKLCSWDPILQMVRCGLCGGLVQMTEIVEANLP